MKIKIALAILFILPLALPQALFAQTLPVTTNTTISGAVPTNGISGDQTGIISSDKNVTTQTTNLKDRANMELTRRITALNNLITRLNTLQKISATDKQTFITAVQTEVTNLTTLQSKIAADTDVTTLRADVKSIVDSYRVFALFLPQMRLLVAADTILATADKMTDIITKMQVNASADKQPLFTDMQAKIADAKLQATAAITEVKPLIPAGYPANKTTLMDAEAKIKAAIADLQGARVDALQIRNSIGDKSQALNHMMMPSGTQPQTTTGGGLPLRQDSMHPLPSSTTNTTNVTGVAPSSTSGVLLH